MRYHDCVSIDDDNITSVDAAATPGWSLGSKVNVATCFLAAESGPDAGTTFGPLGEQTLLGRKGFLNGW